MKKIILTIAFCMMLLSSCGNNGTDNNTISSEHDKTVSIDTLYTMTPEDTEYIHKNTSTLRTKIYSGPLDLASDSDIIVLATADAPESFVFEGNLSISNKVNYTIQYVFQGDFVENDCITVIENGGIMPYELYYEHALLPFSDGEIEFNDSKIGSFSTLSASDGDLPKEGEQYVLFLRDASDFVPGSYTTVGGYTGRYIKNDFGVFSRYEPEPGFYPSTTERMALYPEQTFANEMFGEQNPNFTFEEFQLLLK